MPGEVITLYLKDLPNEPIACDRLEYGDNSHTTYREHHPGIIDVFLFNKYGDLLLQKRGRNKQNNPGRLHTSVGGHISWGEEAAFSVVHECMEELGAPAFVFSKETYEQAYAKLGPYTHKAALLYEAGVFFRNHADDPIERRRTIKDRVWLYFGRYDGPTETPDRESAGYEWINLDVLEREFETNPEQFTEGLKLFMAAFGGEMRSFIGTFCTQ